MNIQKNIKLYYACTHICKASLTAHSQMQLRPCQKLLLVLYSLVVFRYFLVFHYKNICYYPSNQWNYILYVVLNYRPTPARQLFRLESSCPLNSNSLKLLPQGRQSDSEPCNRTVKSERDQSNLKNF